MPSKPRAMETSTPPFSISISGDLVYQVADILTEQRVPFIFVTGYDADNVDGRFRNVPILQKPVEQEALRKLLCKQPDLAKAVGE